ncbi:MAG: DUF4388 domain-containing protein [bacterium]
MDLQGKIEKFNLSEIFQLISTSHRSGTLQTIRDELAAMFYFRDGKITNVYTSTSDLSNQIGRRLIARGFITMEILDDYLDKQKQQSKPKRIGQILVENELINKEQLGIVLTEQITDIIFKVMTWEWGVFSYYDGKFPTEEDNTLSLCTEGLILEGAHRMDQLNRLKERLPNFNALLKINREIESQKADIEAELSEYQRNILALCDGHQSIDSILNDGDDDPVMILETLVHLVDKNIIQSEDIVTD